MVGIKKYQDESWIECAKRLGRDARFEGVEYDFCPFPKGWLREAWRDAWVSADWDLAS